MNLTEVKREYEQRNSGFHVFPFAAETVGQARQSAHSHSDGEVRSFDMAGTDQIAIRITDPRLNHNALQFAGGVARRAFRHSRVNLNQLTIIDSCSQAERNGVRISIHAVSRQLKVARRGFIQLFNKDFGILPIATAKMPSKDQLASSFDCEKRPRITLAFVIRVALVTFLAIAKSPKLIRLDFIDLKAVNPVLQDALAFISSDFEDAKHGRNSYVAQSGSAANATAFGQTIKDAKEFFVGQIDRLNWFARSIREGALTVSAFESISFVAAKMAVKVGISTAVIWALHSVTKSFLTAYTVGNTIRLRALSGVNSVSQVKDFRECSNTPFSPRLVRVVGFQPTTTGLVIRCSMRLSYTRILKSQRASLLVSFLSQVCPAITCFPATLKLFYCASLLEPFQYAVNARQRVIVLFKIVTASFKRVANIFCGSEVGSLFEDFTASVGQLHLGETLGYNDGGRFSDVGRERKQMTGKFFYSQNVFVQLLEFGFALVAFGAQQFKFPLRFVINVFPIRLFWHSQPLIAEHYT